PVRARKAASSRSPGSLAPAQSIARSPTRTRPRSGRSSRLMQRSNVDLPEPDGPIKATAEPLATSSDMPLLTCSDPNAFHRLHTAIMTSSLGTDIGSIGLLQAPLNHLGAQR